MKGYLMYCGEQWYLAFGTDPVEAARGLEAWGVPFDRISVSQTIAVEQQAAYKLTTQFGGVLVKELSKCKP